MKIYTKTGDDGTTSLFDGTRVQKDHLRVKAYGNVDELNSCLGLVRSHIREDARLTKLVEQIQADLFALGAQLANPSFKKQKSKSKFGADKITFLEKTIDWLELESGPVKNFVLPGGSIASAYADFARTLCRRAERNMVTLSRNEGMDDILIVYANRLSDLLFMLARLLNKKEGIKDLPWEE